MTETDDAADPSAGASVESPVPLSIVPGRAVTTIAFSTPSWAGVARVRGVASGQHDPPALLGSPDRTSPDAAPLLFSTTRGVGVAYREPEGAFVATLGEQGLVRAPERVLPAARALALAPGRRGTRIVTWDGRRVHTIGIDERGDPNGERTVWLERAGRSAHLAAARVGTGTIAAIAFDDEPALHVLSEEEDGRPRVVRHELSSACSGLSMAGTGNRAGCAIVLEHGDKVAVAQLDASGRFVDRPATLVEGRGTRWDAPVVLFVEDGFALVVRDVAGATAALYRFDGRAPLCTLDRVFSPPAAAWHEKKLWVASATLADGTDDVSVLVRRTSLGKRQPALVTPLVIAPPAALRTTRAEARALRTLEEAASELTTTTYRGQTDVRAGTAEVDRDQAALTLGQVRASIEVDEAGYLVVVVARGADEPADPVPLDSFERLARWVRLRLSKKAWEASVSEASWVDALAADLGGTGRVAPTRSGVVLLVSVATLPAGAVVAHWLKRIQADVARCALPAG